MQSLLNAIGRGATAAAHAIKQVRDEVKENVAEINQQAFGYNILTITSIALAALAFFQASIVFCFLAGLSFVARFHMGQTLESNARMIRGIAEPFFEGGKFTGLFWRPFTLRDNC